jgi:Prolyl oligopeptidase family
MGNQLVAYLVLGTTLIQVSGSVISSGGEGQPTGELPPSIAGAFHPPLEFEGDFGPYKSPLVFDDGRPVRDAAAWRERRQEILAYWHGIMGAWPPLIDRPRVEVLATERRENFEQRRVRVEIAPRKTSEGYLLIPEGRGPFPTMLVVFYEPETGIGRGKERRDFAYQLARRGFITLSIGLDPYGLDPPAEGIEVQPLSYLAYVSANLYDSLSMHTHVDPKRIGVMGHSYGGKWAMFAACLDERFACGVWSDPGVVFDESRPNVNYWEPWYLGREPGKARKRGVITAESPRTGAYKRLVESGHDLHELHALMAPRPFLVSGGSEDPPERWRALNHAVAVNKLLGSHDRVAMTNRPGHDPITESNEQIYRFLEYVLRPGHRADN